MEGVHIHWVLGRRRVRIGRVVDPKLFVDDPTHVQLRWAGTVVDEVRLALCVIAGDDAARHGGNLQLFS